jgi:hypothetical protein
MREHNLVEMRNLVRPHPEFGGLSAGPYSTETVLQYRQRQPLPPAIMLQNAMAEDSTFTTVEWGPWTDVPTEYAT